MPTAFLHVLDRNNKPIIYRAFVDTGLTKHVIREELGNKLLLNKMQHHIQIGGLNEMYTVSTFSVTACIKFLNNGFVYNVKFLAVRAITCCTPEQQINRNNNCIPSIIKLADPGFYKPAPVQLLIRAGTYLSILCIGQIRLSKQNHQN